MGTPEISLNTSDASNLYVIDYNGGSGGEFLGELVSDAVGCVHTRKKLPNDDTSIDSFRNILVQPFINKLLQSVLYNGHENTDVMQADLLVKNLMIMHYWQKKKIEPTNIVKQAAIACKITDRVLLRNHLAERDFSSLPNRKHIYIYPDTNEYHITLPLMFKKQWMQKYNKGVYKWEWANDERNLECKDFNEFVDLFFKTSKSEKTTETIDTSYGVNISPKAYAYGIKHWKEELEDYIKAKIGNSEEILSWQNNNLNILKEFGLNIDSTEQQCIDRIKDVYSRNN